MKVVIDTNRLQSHELWGFLAMSTENVAVLPDYVLMEVFKPGHPAAVQRAFLILGQFPNQVLALNGTGEVSVLNPDLVDVRRAMVSEAFAADFPDFLERIQRAGRDRAVDAAIAERAAWSREHMDRMLRGFADMAPAMEEFVASFSGAELRRIRQQREPFTPAMTQKLLGLAAGMAEAIFEARGLPLPSARLRSEHFIFRNSLCYAVSLMSRVRQGARAWRSEVARNDAIDGLLATYGTYFDGIMSHDRLANEVFHVGRHVMRETGAVVGGDYGSERFNEVIAFLEAQPSGTTFGGAVDL